MNIRQKASADIEEKKKQLASFHDAINENLVLARIAAGDAERLRVLSLIDQVLEDHDVLAKTMHQNVVHGADYTPSVIHDRARAVLVSLREAVSGGVDACRPVDYPDVSTKPQVDAEDDDSDIRDSYDQTPRDPELEGDIVKLMRMSGTDSVGNMARWTVDEVRVGLHSIRPNIDELVLVKAMGSLTEEGVLIPYGSKDGGAKFALADKHATPLDSPEFSVADAILRILKLAKDDADYYIGWTYNQLIAAVRRESAKISAEAVEEAIALLNAEGQVVTWKGEKNRYIAIDDVTMTRYRNKLKTIGHEPRNATPPPEPAPEQETRQESEEINDKLTEAVEAGDMKKAEAIVEDAIKKGKQRAEAAEESEPEEESPPNSWDDVKAKLGLEDSWYATSLAGHVLKQFRMQSTRLWRDYDIDGLFKGYSHKHALAREGEEPTQLSEALEHLIALDLVEFIKRDTRPGLHENRWGLTELGRVETE
jgi:hypothetical protein